MSGVPVSALLASPRGRIAVLVLRFVVAALFLTASKTSIEDPTAFATAIDNYRMMPDALIGPMAVGMPLLELLVGVALLTGVHARGAALVAASMLVVFAIAMVQAIARGIDIDCGCFGHVVETRVSWLTVTRNVVLAFACGAIALGPDLPLWPLRRAAEPGRASPSSAG